MFQHPTETVLQPAFRLLAHQPNAVELEYLDANIKNEFVTLDAHHPQAFH